MCSTCYYLKRMATARDDVGERVDLERAWDRPARRYISDRNDDNPVRNAESPQPRILVDRVSVRGWFSGA